ncbi:hypothetical protein F2Q70_00022608 [Brassica cretica]|uniref:Uncharacterized protein n=1 Tax=Brassica cretica TaxID=69181 RepID=A0A8S9GJZ1_BRACR|nr:hypothetical protein F2Q70_00022608 [Brassica cretica]
MRKPKGTCPAVPEATRKLNCYSHQILQAWNPPSTRTPVSLTDTRSPPSTEDTLLPLTDIFHSTSIDTSVRTSIDTEPQDMVATLILVRDEKGDLHDQEGYLRNAAGQRINAQGVAILESDTYTTGTTLPVDEAARPRTLAVRVIENLASSSSTKNTDFERKTSATILWNDQMDEKTIDVPKEESVDSSPGDWENDYYNPTLATHTRDTMHTEEYDEDYEEERAIEHRAILDEEDRLLHHSSWKKKAPSIDRNVSTSIDINVETSRKRASTDIGYYPSIDTNIDYTREGDYSIGSWADDRYHESYAVETTVRDQGADELHEGFTYEELLSMQRRDETDQQQAEVSWERTRFSHPIDKANRPSIDNNLPSSIDTRPKPKSTISEKAKHDKHYLTPDEFAGGVDNHFKQKNRHNTRPSINVADPTSVDRRPEFAIRAYDCDEYGVYRDDQSHARDVDGHVIRLSKDDIRRLLERAWKDEHSYICLPEHASLFT